MSDCLEFRNDEISIGVREIWRSRNRSYRRILLDAHLANLAAKMRGRVIDVGGKRVGRHGLFSPASGTALEWFFLNIDPFALPDLRAAAEQLPISSNSVDWVVCTETIEHLAEPELCVQEIFRILKPDGWVTLSVPFLFPVHGDPFDFRRFTAHGLRHLLGQFTNVKIAPMGGFWGVVGMFLRLQGDSLAFRPWRWLLRQAGQVFCCLDSMSCLQSSCSRFTTGYFCVAQKPRKTPDA